MVRPRLLPAGASTSRRRRDRRVPPVTRGASVLSSRRSGGVACRFPSPEQPGDRRGCDGSARSDGLPELPRRIRGHAARARRGRLRRRPGAVQRDDRPAAGADRAMRLDRGRGRGGALRPRGGARDRGARRRPRRRRAGALRRRAGDRPAADERRQRRPGGRRGGGRRRRDDEQPRPGDRALRPGDDRRPGVDHRGRRLRARRRQRLARPQDGARLRQPRRCRSGDGGRAGADRVGRSSTPSSSGRCMAAAATSGWSPR